MKPRPIRRLSAREAMAIAYYGEDYWSSVGKDAHSLWRSEARRVIRNLRRHGFVIVPAPQRRKQGGRGKG